MNYQCTEKQFFDNMTQIMKKYSKFIIYPYGEWGRKAEKILVGNGIGDYLVTDSNIKKDNKTYIEMNDIKGFVKSGYCVLLCSDNRALYWELRKEIIEYCPAGYIIDVCYMNTTFEMQRYMQNDVRVATLESCAREIYDRNISGHVAEAGVYQGWFSQYINRLFPDRSLFLFDTFGGFDQRDCKVDIANSYSCASQDFSDTNVQLVLDKMKYKEKCIIRKGFFPDTATDISEDEFFCFVSLDMDLYQPIYEGLKFFYPRLSEGGYIFVHDCRNIGYLGARQAVLDYCQENHIGYVILTDEYGTAVITK